MTPEQQRIAIAEACGWELKYRKPPNIPGWNVWEPGSLYPAQLLNNLEQKLPDYLNDLNAMHEAERTMGDPQLWDEYQSYLSDAMRNIGWIYHATAAQRARAFLRTIGKWEVESW